MMWVFEDYGARLVDEQGRVVGRVSATNEHGEQDFGFWFAFDEAGKHIATSNDPFRCMDKVQQVAKAAPCKPHSYCICVTKPYSGCPVHGNPSTHKLGQ